MCSLHKGEEGKLLWKNERAHLLSTPVHVCPPYRTLSGWDLPTRLIAVQAGQQGYLEWI